MLEPLKLFLNYTLPSTFTDDLTVYETISKIVYQCNALLTEIEQTNSELDSFKEQIETINAEINKLNDYVTSNEQDKRAIRTEIDTIQTGLTNIRSQLNIISGNISSLQDSDERLQNQVNTLTGEISLLKDKTSLNQSRIDTLEGSVQIIRDDLNGTQLTKGLKEKVTDLETTVNGAGATNGLVNDVSAVQRDVLGLQTTSTQQAQEIESLHGDVASTEADLRSLENKVDSLDVKPPTVVTYTTNEANAMVITESSALRVIVKLNTIPSQGGYDLIANFSNIISDYIWNIKKLPQYIASSIATTPISLVVYRAQFAGEAPALEPIYLTFANGNLTLQIGDGAGLRTDYYYSFTFPF